MLIFLDIDGVMVPAASWKAPQILEDGFPAFSSQSASVLQNLISVSDTVMLTTSHKSKYSIKEWKHIFERRGIKIENIQTLPENKNNLSRKEEIIKWVNVHGIEEHFIIIDDDKSLHDLPRFLKEHLILTSSLTGLTNEHLRVIQSMLAPGLHKA